MFLSQMPSSIVPVLGFHGSRDEGRNGLVGVSFTLSTAVIYYAVGIWGVVSSLMHKSSSGKASQHSSMKQEWFQRPHS